MDRVNLSLKCRVRSNVEPRLKAAERADAAVAGEDKLVGLQAVLSRSKALLIFRDLGI